MAKRKAKVVVIKESKTGLNEKVKVNGKEMTHKQAYKEAKNGNIPGYHAAENKKGTKYIKSNPDRNTKNNLE